MFIEQLKNNKDSLLKYLPFPLLFFVLMGMNFFVSSGKDTNEMVNDLIAQVGKNMTFFTMLIPFAFMLICLFIWVKVFHKQSITSLTTGRKKVDFYRVFFSFSIWSIVLIAFTAISYYLNPNDYELVFKPVPFLILLIIAIVLIPLQTSFEEYFFRGYLLQGLGLAFKNKLVPFLSTSILFGLMHIANPEVGDLGYQMLLYYIGAGFFLGILTLMDDGLELALGYHAANNLFGVLLITSNSAVFQTNAILEQKSASSLTEIYIQVFVIFPILLFIFSKKFRWNNWKDRLTGKI